MKMNKILKVSYKKNFFKRGGCCAKLLQSCPKLCDPMDCNLLGSSVSCGFELLEAGRYKGRWVSDKEAWGKKWMEEKLSKM